MRARRALGRPYNSIPGPSIASRGRRLRALLSVSDRDGIIELARSLIDAGTECFATDGTRAHLTEAGIEGIRSVADLTETNEILGGRVKTLHPNIFAGLLARRDQPDH